MSTPIATAGATTIEFHDDRRDLVTNLDTGEKHYVFFGKVFGWAEELPSGNTVWCHVPVPVLQECFGYSAAQPGGFQDGDYNAAYLANQTEIQAAAKQHILARELEYQATPHPHYNVHLTHADFVVPS